MARTRTLWVPVLVALLVAALIGPGITAGAEPRAAVSVTVVIPAAAFTPTDDSVDYSRGPGQLQTDTGSGTFAAPVFFEAPTVTIKKVTFYAIDAGSGNLILGLYRTQPAQDQTIQLGEVYTTGSSWDMQTITLSSLTERKITGAYGATLNVYLPGTYPNGYRFLGAKVTYTFQP